MVRYAYTYDGIIIQSMIKSYVYLSVHRDRKLRAQGKPLYNDRKGVSRPHSFTDIYKMIKGRFPTVSKETIQTHLNKMVEKHILVKLPNEGRRYNKTLYVLDDKIMRDYLARMMTIQTDYGCEPFSFSLIYRPTDV